MTEMTLSIPEIHCGHCKASIESADSELDSIKKADEAKYKNNPYYQKIIALKAKLAEIQKAYYAYMKEAGTEYENMNEEERAEYRTKTADYREQIEKIKKAIEAATEEFEKSKKNPE